MPETTIDSVAELSQHALLLKSLGYTTTDQLAGAVRAAGNLLADFLGVSRENLDDLVRNMPHTRQPFADALPKPRPLGVRLDSVPRHRRAPMMSLVGAPLPPKVDLIAEMQPIRDQGGRGTCVAHASAAAAEHYWRSQGKVIDLSRQFLYWDCKQNDGQPDAEGTWVGVAMPQLLADGCCLELSWPYVMAQISGDESQGPPPPAAATEAPQFKIPAFHNLSPTSVLDIKGELARGRCVAFSIPVFDSWYQNTEVTRTGQIVNPIPEEVDVGGHAMCFVGYEDMPSETALGGGVFYLRNSWDSNWATQSVIGQVGFGTIPYSYIARFGSEAFSIG